MPVRRDTGQIRDLALPFGPEEARPAAVLVVIAPDDGRDESEADAEVLLIRRVDRGGHHSGQIAFPGGRSEAGDTDATATAIREAEEEVALDAEACGLRVIGELERFWIPVSGYQVTPVVAVAARRPIVRASEAEVAEILWAPLAAFLPDAPIEQVETTVRDIPIGFGAYNVRGVQVWGATARILGQLGAVLGDSRT